MTVSPTDVTVTEGGSATYTVVLDAQPSGNVVISVTKTGSTDVTVSPATLTFSSSNWDTAKTVRVSAAQDADAVNDAASITHAVVASRSANEYAAATIAGVAVTVTDDDTAGATVSPATLRIPEGGQRHLHSEAGRSAHLRRGDHGEQRQFGRDGGHRRSDVRQPDHPDLHPVQLGHGEDGKGVRRPGRRRGERRGVITHAVVDASSANEYDAATIAGVAVTVTDDDDAGVSPPDQSPTFASRTVDDQVYTVGEDVGTVSLPSALKGNGRLRYSLSPDLPEGLRFNSDRTITGTPRAKFPRTRFTYTASDIDGDRVHLRFHITVNETAGVTVSPTDVTVTEGGSATYTVVLDAQPSGNVVISVTKTGSTDVTVSPATLTFSSSNWDTAKTVRVSAAQDADAVNDAASITHAVVASRSANEYAAATIAGVAVTVTDDDTAGATVSPATLRIPEGGSATYTVRLDAQPTSDVVITVSSDNSDVTADTDAATSGNQTTLTFTPSNWSTAQTVTVRAAQDVDAVNDAAAITHAVDASRSADEYDAAAIAGVAVTVTDDDTAGATVSPATLRIPEGGSATYTVRLDAQPTSDVVITVSSDNSDVTADTDAATSGNQTTLTFTPSNWDTAQTVTVRAAQDADAVNDAASISHAVVDADSADEFDLVTVAGVRVTVTDDDTAGATVSETTLSITEGNSSTYTVVLDAQPASDVVISVTRTGSTDVTVSPATLTFTRANWSTAQTVRVSAAQDADAVNDAASIAHAVVAAQSADEYDAVTIGSVAVTVTDNDAGATVSETTLTVTEGNSSTYTVVLDAQPASDVVISVTKSGSTDVTVSPATLTFTSGPTGARRRR